MKNSRNNIIITFLVILALLLFPVSVVAQEDTATETEVDTKTDVTETTTDKETPVTTKKTTIKDKVEEKRLELERLRQLK